MRSILFAAGLLILGACGSNEQHHHEERKDGFSQTPKTPVDSLFDLVMKGHDVAMPKMGKIAAYRKDAQEKIAVLSQQSAAAKDSTLAALKQLDAELAIAEDGMTVWMDKFVIDSAENNVEQRIDYLKSELAKVNTVRDQVLNGLAKADSLLKK